MRSNRVVSGLVRLVVPHPAMPAAQLSGRFPQRPVVFGFPGRAAVATMALLHFFPSCPCNRRRSPRPFCLADFARLGEEVNNVLKAGADWVHFDVMDNHYVPNLTIGSMVCQALRKHGITAPIDVHLMVEPVDRIVPDFADAGATTISFHPEASRHVHRTIQLIKSHGCQAGLVLNPATPVDILDWVLPELDLVLVMSVNPGFGGQAFIPSALDKLRAIRTKIDALGKPIRLEIDGGVKADNIGAIAAAGADTFVAGSAIFNAPDYAQVIAQMRAAVEAVR